MVGTWSNNRLPYTGSLRPVPSSANRSKSDFVVSGPTIRYGVEIGAGTGDMRLLAPSLSVFSLIR